LENLGEIVPDGVFGYGSVLFRCLLDDSGEVTTATVLHEDVENSSVSVDISVVVSYNVVVMKVLENVSTHLLRSVGDECTRVGQDAHFYMLPISFAHPLKFEFLEREYLRETTVSLGTRKCHQ